MKKIIAFVMALVLMAPVMAYADSKEEKKIEKMAAKSAKNKFKEYKKGKWEHLGTLPLEDVLKLHFKKLYTLGEDGHEVEGISTKTKSKNNGKQAAMNNAYITYAQEAGSTLKGRIVADLNANGVDVDGEFDNFYAAYERLVETEIKGEMEHSFSIIREIPGAPGTYEVRCYYIVSEKAAAKARRRALDEALKSSEAARKYADKISGFVNEGFSE